MQQIYKDNLEWFFFNVKIRIDFYNPNRYETQNSEKFHLKEKNQLNSPEGQKSTQVQ